MTQNLWAGPRGKAGWGVKLEGSSRDIARFTTQNHAWKFAIELGNLSSREAFLQGRDGRIRERNTYGRDKQPPRG
jgi:hypothetical protein